MTQAPIQIDTFTRLNRGLGLMQTGSVVTIDIATPAGQKAKFRSVFLGYLPKKYVLIQFPESTKVGNFGQFITQGAGVTVRGLLEQEGSVAAFVSVIKQTLQIPSKLIVLEFPKTLTIQTLRKSIRIETDIQTKVKIENNLWQAMVTDISINGCQLLIENGDELALIKDKSIDLVVENLSGLDNLKLTGLICSIKPVVNGISLGVKFSDESKPSVVKLIHHVVTIEV